MTAAAGHRRILRRFVSVRHAFSGSASFIAKKHTQAICSSSIGAVPPCEEHSTYHRAPEHSKSLIDWIWFEEQTSVTGLRNDNNRIESSTSMILY
uniref:Uncharacterized protein n=1 Tax=Romanomermis culicivorax TaxID=13658 RepID=A0A915KTM5_ROMCU